MKTAFIFIFIIAFTGFLGLLLSYIAQRFPRKEDPRVDKVYEVLPKTNCGACGFASCDAYAKAVVSDTNLIGQCKVGGDAVAGKISRVLGVTPPKNKGREVARVRCQGGTGCKDAFTYSGVKTCRAALVTGTYKECSKGCLGFGDCMESCAYDAITMREGVPHIDTHACVACGACERACPQNLISVEPEDHKVIVRCMSRDYPKKKAKVCEKSCIACHVCEKVCPKEAIKVVDGCAEIDYKKCIACGACVKKCPKGAITFL